MIELLCHKSSSYAPRTYHNASQGVTLAIAADHNTAGERLTQKAANGKIAFIDATQFKDQWLDCARQLYVQLKRNDCRVVNVAGNGIYTLAKYDITQVMMNDMVRQILFQVDQFWKLDKVVSGGQSGADLAGLIAAAKIGIPCTGMWPAGFKMRHEDGVDRTHTYEQVMEIINQYA
jgi:hypothetical protein